MSTANKASCAFSTLNRMCRRICPARFAPTRYHATRAARRRLVAIGRRQAQPRCGRRSRRTRKRSARSMGRRYEGSTLASTKPSSSAVRGGTSWSKSRRAVGQLLVSFLRGENIKRWRVESEALFLINIPKGKIKIDDYPAIRDHFCRSRPSLKRAPRSKNGSNCSRRSSAYQAADSNSRRTIWPQIWTNLNFV